MATILFQAAGAALGGIFGPVGALVGRAAGALAGNALDRALIGGETVRGARLSMARIPGADDGTAIPRVYGTARIGGTLIWATRFVEEVNVERSGGKATGSRVETYRYYANIAIGICEGPVAHIRRVFADGRELDLTKLEMRLHTGTATQMPDPLIEAVQGEGRAPGFRGLAYAVFERLPLDTFGNRIPVLQFEVLKPVGALERQLRAVTMIPGSTEHGYHTTAVSEADGEGGSILLNRHVLSHATDWEASLDELTALAPGLKSVALVVAWFGTDLRAGECRILPGVETASRPGESFGWSVSGISRANAHVVSLSNGGPAYGGTPSDASVVAAIADLKARGLNVYLYPFLMMDIPAGNSLPDPHGGARQAAYPWRGRITCYPPGSDGTAGAGAQIAAFCGDTAASGFAVSGTDVTWSGGDEGYRRLVLHYAHLAKAAGGVDGFIIGSELIGLTTVRNGTGGFPFVSELVRLCADVRAILGSAVKLTYGADWSEYFGYHPADGTGDVFFHLDPLWASPDIDAVGIDNYMPLADWRDGDLSEPDPDGYRLADDPARLEAAITSGEGRDWYYESAADRRNRIRSPITDGLAGKPLVFRYKDIEGWWSNLHYNRVGGVERTVATAWRPRMKPVWLTELGCPAVDKGANQPNVFSDPKSSEDAFPYHANGTRSDTMQRRFLEAHHRFWQSDAAPAGMIDPDHVFVWTWDARPFPAFPKDATLWSDGANWRTGHWLTGRLGAGTLADVIAAILSDHGFSEFDVSEVSGDLAGYVQGAVGSARGLIEPLMSAFQIDAIADGDRIRFRSRQAARLPLHRLQTLADIEDEPLWSENRVHEGDLASEAVIGFLNPMLDHEQASVRSRRTGEGAERIVEVSLPGSLAEETALAAAESLLRDHRTACRTVRFALSPAAVSVETGDAVVLEDGPPGRFLVTRIEEGAVRRIEGREYLPSVSAPSRRPEPARKPGTRASEGFAPVLRLMDLPAYDNGAEEDFARGAVVVKPWRPVVLSSSPGTEGYRSRMTFDRPARAGMLVEPLLPGFAGRFDHRGAITAKLFSGALSSAGRLAVLGGENRVAVMAANGVFEVISFATAEETGSGIFRLSGLLRGLAGTTDAMAAGAEAGADIVVLDAAVKNLDLTPDEAGLALNWIAEPASGSAGLAGPVAFAGGRRAATPFAPVHLRAVRLADGSVRFSWVRCGRRGSDSWEGSDIPLDEADERYRIDILSGESIVRQADIGTPAFVYSQADEMTDFAAAQAGFSIRVRQLGRKVPLGIAAAAFLSL